MDNQFTMDGYQDLDSVASSIQDEGCTPAGLKRVKATTASAFAEALRRVEHLPYEQRQFELYAAVCGMVQAARDDELIFT